MAEVLSNTRVLLLFLEMAAVCSRISAQDTLLSDKLRGSYAFKQDEVALYLFAMIATSFVTTLLSLLIPKDLNKRPLIIISLALTAATSLLIGPSALLGLPD